MTNGRTSHIDPRRVLTTQTRRLPLQGQQLPGGAQLYHLPSWGKLGHAGRVAQIRKLITSYGRDPRIRNLALSIVKQSGVQPRDYDGQAAAILAWVQNPANVFYANEAHEQLQSPMYTLRVKTGDCDDLVILLGSLYDSIRLSNRLVLSGRNRQGKMVRWMEGRGRPPRGVQFSHIYMSVGTPPFRPTKWHYTEPTAQKPLGWDVVQADAAGVLNTHPELAGYGAFSPPILTPQGQVVSLPYGASEADEESAASLQQATEAASTPPVVVDKASRELALVGFVKGLDWKGIAAATLPAVLSSIFLARYFKGRPGR